MISSLCRLIAFTVINPNYRRSKVHTCALIAYLRAVSMAADEARCHPQKGWRRWVPETHLREATFLPGAGKDGIQHRASLDSATSPLGASALKQDSSAFSGSEKDEKNKT